MIYLLGSIILTSYLTLTFKVIQRFGIPPFQAILFNYWTCVITGSVVNGRSPFHASTLHTSWFPWALLMGFLFISIINLLAFTTQKIGVAVASVANKLSLVIPFLFSIYLYSEKATPFKIAGILLALCAVLLTCWPSRPPGEGPVKKKIPVWYFALPGLLFFGSGLLDTLIKYTEQAFLNDGNKNDFLITAFAAAGTMGLTILAGGIAGRRMVFCPKAVLAGICIGVPNYFSIWCLVQILKTNAGNSSAIIPINNMGVVLFSALAASVFFKEGLSGKNWMGVILALGAIALIAFG